MQPIMIYTTIPSEDEAKKIASHLLEKKLVACANIFSAHTAMFWWQDKIEHAQEIAVIFKTRKELFKEVETQIVQLHSYDVPAIVAIDIGQGHPPFLQWIEAECIK